MTTPPQESTLPNEPEDPDTSGSSGVDPDLEAEDPEVLDPDEMPDVWLDTEDLFDDLSEEEAEQGQRLGITIDPEDDEDSEGEAG